MPNLRATADRPIPSHAVYRLVDSPTALPRSAMDGSSRGAAMNAPETLALLRYVTACCPAQKVDEYTPEAWTDLLGDLRYADAKEAARNLAQSQDFIAPKDVRREVRRIRADRIARHPHVDPPGNLTEIEYRSWLRDTRQAIADGRQIPRPALPQRDMSAIAAIDKRPA